MKNEFKAIVVTVSDLVKTKSNNVSEYCVCTVKFLEGSLKGKTYFAQRTLTDKAGNAKSPVRVGQECIAHLSVVDNKPFFEIGSGSSVDSAEDIMGLLGL